MSLPSEKTFIPTAMDIVDSLVFIAYNSSFHDLKEKKEEVTW